MGRSDQRQKPVFIALAFGFATCLHGCTQSQESSGSETQATAAATESPTPIPANPSELSSLVWRFYHDADLNNKTSYNDVISILSESFLKNHGATLMRDYGYIKNPNVTITGVRGYAVDYTVEYDYVADNKAKLHWQRSGTWVAAHGSSGWQLNEDKWNTLHITSISYPNGGTYAVQDHVYSDGRHVFDIPGIEVTFRTTGEGWKTTFAPLATPTPGLAAQPQYNAAGSFQQPASSAAAAAPGSPCDEVGVNGVYDDGAILELDDGRHLRVAGYDTATSSTWVAPFDALICGDDKVINKDDNESVDLSP